MKKFWQEVGVVEVDGGWQVALDGRGIKTQGKRPQVVPRRALAELLAAEWDAQGDEIDPTQFKHRDMADYAIDMVATGEDDLIGKLLNFLETDTLCYRADPDEPLYKRQQEVWEPIVAGVETREGIAIERASGIVHRPQRAETLSAVREKLVGLDAFQLASLFALTSLAASLVIGLAALEDGAEPEALWDAANLEEDWQVELWGEDAEAADRRVRRLRDFSSAMQFAKAHRL